MKGDLSVTSNGTDHLVFVPGIGTVIAEPHVRAALLMADWERCTPASTGPLPHGPSVYHDARACADPANSPIGLAWVRALVAATVNAHAEARHAIPHEETRLALPEGH